MEIIKKYWLILLIGLILRIVVSGFTYHPDTKSQVIATRSFLEGQFDPYAYARHLSPEAILDKLPMSYIFQFPFHLVGRVLTNDEIENQFFKEQRSLFGQPTLWLYLIYAKLPLIVFDLGLAILLALMVSPSLQRLALLVWILNPVTLWATEAIGQIDVYSAFFILLSFYLLKKGRLSLSALSLGMGAAVKTAPFLLLPLLFIFAKDLKERVTVCLLAVLPIVSTVIWYIHSPYFRNDAFVAPQIGKSLFTQLSLSGGESLIIFVFLLTAIYLFYFQKKRTINEYFGYSIVIFLTTLSVTHFHLQWLLWVLPFLTIYFVENWRDSRLLLLGFIFSFLVMLFLFDSSLQLKLFAPLLPNLDNLKGLVETQPKDSLYLLRSMAASIFAGCSVFLSINLLKQK